MKIGRLSLLGVGLCSIAATAVMEGNASADITSVAVEYEAPFGTFGSRDYVYVEGTITGSVLRADDSTGNYTVPYVLMYPKANANGFGVVDVPNTAFFEQYPRNNACQTESDPANYNDGCANRSLKSVCETRGDFLCQMAGSVLMSDNRYEQQIGQLARAYTEDYLFQQGYTVISVMWHRAVTEQFGDNPPDATRRRLAYGSITDAADDLEIVRDASRFLRDPAAFNLGDAPTLAATTTNIGFGYSNAGMLLKWMMFQGLNAEADTSLVYDGIITAGTGTMCHRSTDIIMFDWSMVGGTSFVGDSAASTYGEIFPCALRNGFPPSGGVPNTGGAKMMTIQSTTDLLTIAGAAAREIYTVDVGEIMAGNCSQPITPVGFGGDCPPNPDYRNYEIAGVSHIPADVIETSWMGATAQNPGDPRPVYRAMFSHMHDWIANDTAPPAGVAMDGTANPQQGFRWTPDFDGDGNEAGGIRLPHIDAALGVHGAVDPTHFINPSVTPPIMNIFPLSSGTYAAFDDAKLASLYPADGDYEAAVKASADAALAAGHILQEDHDRYLAGIGMIPVNPTVADPEGTPGTDDEIVTIPGTPGSNCSTGGGAGGMAGALVLFAFVALRRRKSAQHPSC